MIRHILGVLAYVVGTLVVQGSSHLVFLKAHYDSHSFLRPEPIFALGISSMLIQGAVLTFVHSKVKLTTNKLFNALTLSWLFGSYVVSYKALGEAGEFLVPVISNWIAVETIAGILQYSLIGILLYFAHSSFRREQI